MHKKANFLVFPEFHRALSTFPWTSHPGASFFLNFPYEMWEAFPQEARIWRLPYLQLGTAAPGNNRKDLT